MSHIAEIRVAFAQQPWSIHPPVLSEILALAAAGVDAAAPARSPHGEAYQVLHGTAYIPLTGILQPSPNAITRWLGGTATSEFERDVISAIGRQDVSRIVLLVDSPGGSAIGNEEAAQTIYAARGGKPITAFVRGMCASAAYYIASAADRIVASPSSSVGSIGTILYHSDHSKMLHDWGITVTPIHHGKHKADGNPYQPLGEQGARTLQEFVDAYGRQFVSAVARHRDATPGQVLERYGQGRMYIAGEAVVHGLIDEVGTLRAIQASAHAAAAHQLLHQPPDRIKQALAEAGWTRYRDCANSEARQALQRVFAGADVPGTEAEMLARVRNTRGPHCR